MDVGLTVFDYALVIGSIAISAMVGFYFGVFKKKNDSVEEYFLASRDLNWFKMGCSLFATMVSSGFVIGLIAETYFYGFISFLGFPAYFFAQILNMKIFFPVFHKIGSYDLYKFYELKFSVYIRYFLSVTTMFDKILMNSVVVYGTASAFSKISGIETWYLNIALTVICVVYSSLGGTRGVTLADMVQSIVIFVSIMFTCVLGTIHIGGATEAWNRNWNGGRLDIFDFNTDPTARHTFWTATIAMPIMVISGVTTSQTSTLRVMASDNIKTCYKAIMFSSIVSLFVIFLCVIVGLLTYALYYNCDPFTKGIISNPNQLVTLFVMDCLSNYTGLIGLFFAGLICAAISTLSSNLNGVTALTMETLIKPFNPNIRDEIYTRWAKIFGFILSALSLVGIIVVEQFPNVYQAMMTISAISNGPHFSLLLIACFFPKASLVSSIGSFSIGLLLMLWVLIGGLVSKFPTSPKKPVTVAGCATTNFSSIFSVNETFFETTTVSSAAAFSTELPTVAQESSLIRYFPLSAVSYTWITFMGILLTLLPFAILTMIFRSDVKAVDVNLIPVPIQNFHKKLSRKWRKILLCDVYSNDEEEEDQVNIKLTSNGQNLPCDNNE